MQKGQELRSNIRRPKIEMQCNTRGPKVEEKHKKAKNRGSVQCKSAKS
jgi:hypothetical protein